MSSVGRIYAGILIGGSLEMVAGLFGNGDSLVLQPHGTLLLGGCYSNLLAAAYGCVWCVVVPEARRPRDIGTLAIIAMFASLSALLLEWPLAGV